jgi:hypothetical protein
MPYQAETPVEVGKFMGIIARVRLSESADVLPLFHLHDHLPPHASRTSIPPSLHRESKHCVMIISDSPTS